MLGHSRLSLLTLRVMTHHVSYRILAMQVHRTTRFGCLLLACWSCITTAGFAQLPTVKHQRLGVDYLLLTSGEKLYGFSLGKNEDGLVTFAVERKWLKQTHPKLFERESTREQKERKQTGKVLLERIDQWIDERKDDPKSEGLVRFLKYKRDKIEFASDDNSNEPNDALFMLFHLELDEIQDLKQASRNNRFVAGIAYGRGIENIVTTPASILRKRLAEADKKWTEQQVDLADELPKSVTQSEKEWAARKAILEYHMREPLEYQGTGSTLLRLDEQVDMTALAAQLLARGGAGAITQVGIDLGLPEFQKFKKDRENKSWSKKITTEAEKDGFRGVFVVRLEQSMTSSSVKVHSHFFVMEEPGNWFELRNNTSTSNVNQQAVGDVAQLKQDPQVKQAVDLISKLLPGAADRVDLAMQHGAATQQALSQAKSEFTLFLEKYTNDLDTPLQIPNNK